jgi:hypothetical protein
LDWSHASSLWRCDYAEARALAERGVTSDAPLVDAAIGAQLDSRAQL